MSGGTQEPPKSARVVSSDPMERIATALEQIAEAISALLKVALDDRSPI